MEEKKSLSAIPKSGFFTKSLICRPEYDAITFMMVYHNTMILGVILKKLMSGRMKSMYGSWAIQHERNGKISRQKIDHVLKKNWKDDKIDNKISRKIQIWYTYSLVIYNWFANYDFEKNVKQLRNIDFKVFFWLIFLFWVDLPKSSVKILKLSISSFECNYK